MMKKTLLLISLIFLVGCASESELESALTEISNLEAQISQKDINIGELENQVQSLSKSLGSLQSYFDELSVEFDTLSEMPKPVCTPIEALKNLVVDVIDGDTIDLGTGERVRLLGIDSPEVDECGYQEAQEYLSFMILSESVVLVEDRLAGNKDKYGRLLRYIEFNGSDINLMMVKLGYADSYKYDSSTGYPYEREDLYHAEQGALRTCSLPTATPYIAPTQPVSINPCSGMVFQNCAAMKAAGCAPAIQGRDDWYRSERDGDNDGIACE